MITRLDDEPDWSKSWSWRAVQAKAWWRGFRVGLACGACVTCVAVVLALLLPVQ